jgi:hypothetical protein
VQGLGDVSEELRAISRGIYPAILSKGGLGPALRSLAWRSAVPVELDLDVPARLRDQVEVAAYYVVAEALTNAARHAHAAQVKVRVKAADGHLDLIVQDDGAGGADPANGSGLIGLVDRVEAVGGHLWVNSPAGVGSGIRLGRIGVGDARTDAEGGRSDDAGDRDAADQSLEIHRVTPLKSTTNTEDSAFPRIPGFSAQRHASSRLAPKTRPPLAGNGALPSGSDILLP